MPNQASSQITINADKSAVMAVIADFEAYPQWTGQIKKAEIVEPGDGDRAKQVRFVLDAGVMKDDYVLEYDWSGDDEVSWHLVKANMLKAMDGTYSLADRGATTEVTYRLSVDINLPMLGMFKRKAEKVIMDTALKELKKRVES